MYAVNALSGSNYGQIWLDIEVYSACLYSPLSLSLSLYTTTTSVLSLYHTSPLQGSQYWLGSYSENQEFFEGLLSTAKVSNPLLSWLHHAFLLEQVAWPFPWYLWILLCRHTRPLECMPVSMSGAASWAVATLEDPLHSFGIFYCCCSCCCVNVDCFAW